MDDSVMNAFASSLTDLSFYGGKVDFVFRLLPEQASLTNAHTDSGAARLLDGGLESCDPVRSARI